jgi:hypothetical protein
MSTYEEGLGSHNRGSPSSRLVALKLCEYVCYPYTSCSAMIYNTIMHDGLDSLQKVVVERDRGSEESLHHTSDFC